MSPYSAILENITYVNNMYVDTLFTLFTLWSEWYVAYVVYVCDTLQNGAIGWRGGDELLNKVVIFNFLEVSWADFVLW